MKKWFTGIAIFFISYFVFLIATMPLAFVINTIDLPKKVRISNVTGTIWQGQIGQALVDKVNITNINTDLSFWSLLIFSPTVDVTFGDAISVGPEGKLSLTASFDSLELNDVDIILPANDIAKKLRLPIPVTAQGNAELTLKHMQLSTSEKLSCTAADGDVNWSRAAVIALDNTIKLSKISAKISCDKGDVTAKISPKNNLGLSVDARFNLPKSKLTGTGYLKPGTKFPEALKPALSFLGRVDNNGRYPLKF